MAKLKSGKKKKKASAPLPWGWIILGAFLLMIIIGGVMGVNAWTAPGKELQAELARIRSTSEPTSPAEAEAWFQTMPGDSTLGQSLLQTGKELRFLQTDASVKTIPIVGANPAPSSMTGPWPTRPAAEALLQRCQPQIDRLLAGVKQPGFAKLPISFQPSSPGLPLETVADFRAMARLLNLRALVLAHQKDWVGVADSLEALLAIVHQLEASPDVILQLVRMAMHGVACNALAEMAPHAEWSNADLARLEQQLSRIRFDTAIKQAFVGDRAIAVQGLQAPASWAALQGGPLKTVKTAYVSDQLWYLARSRRLIDGAGQGIATLATAARQDLLDLEDHRKGGNASAFQYYCTMLAFPASHAISDGVVRTATRNQAALGLIWLLRFRLENNRLPASTEELRSLPGFPRDPLTNTALNVMLNQNEWVIYGVGPDSQDNRGAVDQPSGQPIDVGYRLRF